MMNNLKNFVSGLALFTAMGGALTSCNKAEDELSQIEPRQSNTEMRVADPGAINTAVTMPSITVKPNMKNIYIDHDGTAGPGATNMFVAISAKAQKDTLQPGTASTVEVGLPAGNMECFKQTSQTATDYFTLTTNVPSGTTLNYPGAPTATEFNSGGYKFNATKNLSQYLQIEAQHHKPGVNVADTVDYVIRYQIPTKTTSTPTDSTGNLMLFTDFQGQTAGPPSIVPTEPSLTFPGYGTSAANTVNAVKALFNDGAISTTTGGAPRKYTKGTWHLNPNNPFVQ